MVIETPGNVLKLMENLRNAFRSQQIFEEAFYTESNIRNITAAKNINEIIHQGKSRIFEFEAFDFRNIADNLESYGGGLLVGFKLEIQPDGKKNVVIDGNISSNQPALYYLTIEKMFGHFCQSNKSEFWGSHRLYQEPIDSYGNAAMEYSHQDGDVEEKGCFMFDPAGLLSSFTLCRRNYNACQYE